MCSLDWGSVAEWCVFVLLIVHAALFAWQAWNLQKTVTNGKESEELSQRAYLGIELVETPNINNYGQGIQVVRKNRLGDIPDWDDTPCFRLIIKNSGKTPALDVMHYSEVQVGTMHVSSQRQVPFMGGMIHQSKVTIPPDGNILVTTRMQYRVNPDDVDQLENDKKIVFVMGKISYRTFDKDWVLEYRFIRSNAYLGSMKNGNIQIGNEGVFVCEEGNILREDKEWWEDKIPVRRRPPSMRSITTKYPSDKTPESA